MCEQSQDDQLKELYKYYIEGRLEDKCKKFLSSKFPEVKSRLAYILSAEADTCYLKILSEFINDKIASVRLASAYSLGYVNSFEARKILFERFNTEWDYDIKVEIMKAIGKIGTEADLRYLVLENYPEDDLLFESLYYFFARGIYTEGRINFLINTIVNGSYNNKKLALKILSEAKIPGISFNLKPIFNELLKNDFMKFSPLIIPVATKFNQVDSNIINTVISISNKNSLLRFMRYANSYKRYKKFWNYCLGSDDEVIKSKAIYFLSKNCRDIDLELVERIENIYNNCGNLDVRLSSIQFLASVYPDSLLFVLYNECLREDYLPYFLSGLSIREDSLGFYFFKKILNSIDNRTKYLSYNLLMNYLTRDSCNQEIISKYISWGLERENPIINLIAINSIGKCGYYSNELTPILVNLMNENLNRGSSFLFFATLSDISNYISASAMFSINRRLFRENFGLSYRNIEEKFIDKDIVKRIVDEKSCYYVKVKADKGEIVIKCESDFAPFSVKFFIDSIKKGVYNNSIITLGDDNNTVIFGDTTYVGYTFPGRIIKVEHSPLKFSRNSVGLLNYNGVYQSHQFFVTLSDNANLDMEFTRIGEVIEGFEVLYRLNNYEKIKTVEIID